MPAWPTGTVTFLFTDIAGSTRLWEDHAEAMRRAMARHDTRLTELFAQHGGVVVQPRGEGDSLFVVFSGALDALIAALSAQRALLVEDWGDVGHLQARMALHTGHANLRWDDYREYRGAAVNRCARLRSAASGGQTLLSEATAALVRDNLPNGVTLRDLGAHWLKDLRNPERIYQATAPGLSETFPPLTTLDPPPHNLPATLTSLIGRERQMEAIGDLLDKARLITLTGPAGAGKTRLALTAAAEAAPDFPGGVYFVDLATVTDPQLLLPAVARALAIPETTSTTTSERLTAFLQERRVLLVLDNFEQVMPAATAVAGLLDTCPDLKVLVTSRARLRIQGERDVPVPPLTLPDATQATTPDALRGSAAVALFCDRAREAKRDFVLTPANALAVTEICRQLDGLPLAIVLAAARVRLLSPEVLMARLAGAGRTARLDLLAGGPRDLPPRQQSLRDAIGWSYALLSPAERLLFRRLATFDGSFSLEEVEKAVGRDGQPAVGAATTASSLASSHFSPGQDLPPLSSADCLILLTGLVEQSLVMAEAGENGMRYRMLETMREFAAEQAAVLSELEEQYLPVHACGSDARVTGRRDREPEGHNGRAV